MPTVSSNGSTERRDAAPDDGSPNRLFVVDDDIDALDFVERVASGLGYRVATATTAERLLESLTSFDPTLIIVDLQMPGTDGIALLRELGRRCCRTPVVIASGMDARVLSGAASCRSVDPLPDTVGM